MNLEGYRLQKTVKEAHHTEKITRLSVLVQAGRSQLFWKLRLEEHKFKSSWSNSARSYPLIKRVTHLHNRCLLAQQTGGAGLSTRKDGEAQPQGELAAVVC